MIKIKIKKIGLSKIIYSLFFFLAPFAVSGFYQGISPIGPTSVVFMGLVFIYSLFYIFNKRYILLDKFELNIIFLFILPIIFSIIGICFKILTNDINYIAYIESDLLSRVILIVFNITILIVLLNITKNWSLEKFKNLIKYYYYGVFLFLLIGVWQFFYFIFDIPYLSIETRTHIHSVKTINFFINKRLTSLANEPSFFAPLIIDFILLSIILTKKPAKAIILGLSVLLFSYSGGGYLNLFIVLFASIFSYMKYKNYYISKKHLFLSIILLFFVFLLLVNYSNIFYKIGYPVLGRLGSMFDMQKHSRMFMIIMPFYWVFRDGILNSIFGYGPGSFKFLSLIEKLPNGKSVHVTSNNLFADTVFELGYFGFMSYIAIFFIFLTKSWRGLKNNINKFCAFILSVHLLTSSIYRADFMQPRFWILVFIIIKLIDINSKNNI